MSSQVAPTQPAGSHANSIASRLRSAFKHSPDAWQAPLDQLLSTMFHQLHKSAGWPRQFDFPNQWYDDLWKLQDKLIGLRKANDMVGYRAACELFRRATIQWIETQKQRLESQTNQKG